MKEPDAGIGVGLDPIQALRDAAHEDYWVYGSDDNRIATIPSILHAYDDIYAQLIKARKNTI